MPSHMAYWRPIVKEVNMVLIPVLCPHGQSDQVIKGGKTKASEQYNVPRKLDR